LRSNRSKKTLLPLKLVFRSVLVSPVELLSPPDFTTNHNAFVRESSGRRFLSVFTWGLQNTSIIIRPCNGLKNRAAIKMRYRSSLSPDMLKVSLDKKKEAYQKRFIST
jgi:hypothetical protein